MKILKIKVKDLLSIGEMRALTTTGPRPTIEIDWYKSIGVCVKNLKTEELIVVPWTNIIEIICECDKKE